MHRRTFIVGTGGIAATGAAVGTGAFTTVTANRDLDVEVVGDARAYVTIEPMDTPNGDAYVVEEGQDDTIVGLQFDKVNRQTDSTFANLLQITNHGTQPVRLGVSETESDPIIDDGIGIFAGEPPEDIHPDGVDYDGNGDVTDETGAGFDFEADPVHLEVNETVERIGLSVARDVAVSDVEGTHTIVIKAMALDGGDA